MMLASLLLPLACVAAELNSFERVTLDAGLETQIFLADATADGNADLLVLGNDRLAVRSLTGPFRTAFQLPQGATAFDFVSWPIRTENPLQHCELVYVRGQELWRTKLTADAAEVPDSTLVCTSNTLLATGTPAPHPFPLLMPASTADTRFMLPTAEGLEIRSLDGTLLETRPYQAQSASNGMRVSAISHGNADTGGLVWALRQSERMTYSLGNDDTTERAPQVRPGSESQRAISGASDPATWPWFALSNAPEEATLRACFRTEVGQQPLCVVRVRRTAADGKENFGPEREYPGIPIVNSDTPPDFNGDGYADLLLWRAKRPASAFTEAPRLLSDPSWPVYLQAHLYNPENRRFDPRPLFHIEVSTPVVRFLEPTPAGPFEYFLMADLTGDKRTDLVLSTDNRQLEIYSGLHEGDTAVRRTVVSAEAPLVSVSLLGPLRPDGAQVLLARTRLRSLVIHAPVTADF